MAWASGKVSTREILRNWGIVYFGNLVGSLGLVILVFFSHHLVVTLFFKGILCNLLICLAVWLA
jgi:formate transporter